VAAFEENESETAPGPLDLLPPPVRLGLVLALIAGFAAAFWRGRRFGKLVPEALPVEVPASQVTLGVGRLYRRARAAGHAGAALRAGTASRLARRLGLPSSAAPATLVIGIADAAGRPATAVHTLLYGPPPASAAALAALAGDLHALEKALEKEVGT
jgi:hypothetical protein